MRLREYFQKFSFGVLALFCSVSSPKHLQSFIAGGVLCTLGMLLRGLANSQIPQNDRSLGTAGIYRFLGDPDFCGWFLVLSGLAVGSESFGAALVVSLLCTLVLLLTKLNSTAALKLKSLIWTSTGSQKSNIDWFPRVAPKQSDVGSSQIRRLSFSRGFWKGNNAEFKRVIGVGVAFATLWIYHWSPGVYWVKMIAVSVNVAVNMLAISLAVRYENLKLISFGIRK